MSAKPTTFGSDIPTVLPAGPLEPDVDDAPDRVAAAVDRELDRIAARDARVWDQIFRRLFDPHDEPLDPPERHREWQDVAAEEAGVRRFGPP